MHSEYAGEHVMRSKKYPVMIGMSVVLLAVGAYAYAQAVSAAPAEAEAQAALAASPRHGEWVRIDAGSAGNVDAWVVYPERSDNAPVVIVIHEIFGLTDWVRSVADRLAAEGFIAIAPDFLSGKAPGGGGSREAGPEASRGLIRDLREDEIVRRLNATARYGTSLPAATPQYAVVGYCWGGGISFMYATAQPELDAAVVFYGTSPDTARLANVRAPVLGLYGGDDARDMASCATRPAGKRTPAPHRPRGPGWCSS